MTIGERIKQRRLELGLTQTELAHRMGLTSKTTICKAETTDFNPTTDRVREFAKALDCTPAYLMGWEEIIIESNDEPNSRSQVRKLATELTEKFSNYTPEEIERAIKVFEMYENSTPEVRQTIELLLKSTQPES